MRNCRGDFEFDEPTRRFIKKIQARKFVEPKPLHLELPSTEKENSYVKFFEIAKRKNEAAS